MGRIVLVAGGSGQFAADVSQRLAGEAAVEAVVRFDKRILTGGLDGIDAVLHLGVNAGRSGGRWAVQDSSAAGTMQLLAACQHSPDVRTVVLKSSTAVYGASARDPGVFTEDTSPKRPPRSGYGKDCADLEGYVRGFARRRPDVAVTVLRCADVLDASADSPLAQHLRLPLVPTVMGFDPRLQLLHLDDALAAVVSSVVDDLAGTYNLAGSGVLMLSQLLRRLGRLALPVPMSAVRPIGQSLAGTAKLDVSPDQVAFLSHGRVVDTSAARRRFGPVPRWSGAAVLDDFAQVARRPSAGGVPA